MRKNDKPNERRPTQTVTTHHLRDKELQDISELILLYNISSVSDGNLWTSGGVFCGSEMILQFARSFEGYTFADGNRLEGIAEKVQYALQHRKVL